MTRIIAFSISGNKVDDLEAYAQKLADMVDEAMVAQESGNLIPAGVTYDGIAVEDPDAPEAPETEDKE